MILQPFIYFRKNGKQEKSNIVTDDMKIL